MRNLRYFVWVIFPVAFFVAYLLLGLPHMIWSYDWRDNGTHDPFVERHYTRCSFIGPFGAFTIHHPRNG